MNSWRICQCGCGGIVEPTDHFGPPRKFLPGHYRKKAKANRKQRSVYNVVIYGTEGEVIKCPVSSYNNVQAVSAAVARKVPLDVIIDRIEANGQLIYPNDDINGHTGSVGRPYTFKTLLQYKVGINTQRMIAANVESGRRGDYVDEAIKAKLKEDFGVEL